MKNNETIEQAKFVIGRYDHYYDSVNTKGSFIIGLNTFLLGGLLAGYVGLYEKIEIPQWIVALIIAFGLCSILSSMLTVFAIHPFLNSGNKDTKKRSQIFFGSVSQYDRENFIEAFKARTEQQIVNDLSCQVWILATGLTKKYDYLRIAGWLLIVQLILLVPITLFIFNHLS
ncbi:MAG: hypothetical protein EOO16_11500 [Chitinophagaceae bacterium]|nr:MAG: hypothetical protein EOO16_11500 [Chitinophagaceae bacterium]